MIRLSAAFSALFLFSCTVKEDRGGCPCRLIVDMSRVLDTETTHSSLWNDGLKLSILTQGSFAAGSDYKYGEVPLELEYSVSRGEATVFAVMGVERGQVSGSQYMLPEGADPDPLFAFSRSVDCSGEEAIVTLGMFKQFARVTVLGLDSLETRLVVAAPFAGLDLTTCSALPGKLRFPLEKDEDGAYRFRLPRQGDDSVSILMYEADGQLEGSLPLGKYLKEAGYDWGAESLSDLSVTIDRMSVSVSISIEGWNNSFESPITI